MARADPETIALAHEGLDLNRETGNRRAIADSLRQLGDLACKTNALPEAGRRYIEALRLAVEIEALPLTLEVLSSVARLYAREAQVARSRMGLMTSLAGVVWGSFYAFFDELQAAAIPIGYIEFTVP